MNQLRGGQVQDQQREQHRLFIYGGCVSRDAYDFLDGDKYDLLHYVSRQSVISATSESDVELLAGLDVGGGPWERKNLEGDIRGDVMEQVASHIDEIDTLVWDILIDRNGVVRTTDGKYVTYSYDLELAGVFDRMQDAGLYGERIYFGTERHFSLWTAAVDRFLSGLEVSGLREKLLLIVAPWATTMDDGGTLTQGSQEPSPEEANGLYPRYYEYLTKTKGVRSTAIPETAAIGKRHHKWGPAPYHYVDAAYEHIRESLMASADGYLPKYSA